MSSGLDMMFALVLEDGRLWGEAASDFQVADAEAIFSLDGPRKHFLTRGRGGSKPLALDTPLPTPSGWTTMGALRVGDTLFDERGRPTKVTGLGEVKLGEDCWRVTFDDGSALVTSGNHEWVVEDHLIRSRRNGRGIPTPDWGTLLTVTTVEMRHRLRYGKRGDLNLSVPVAQPFDLPERDLPLHPYVLGAWLGDGSSESSRITVGDVDLDEMRAIFESCGMPFAGCVRKDGARCATWRFGNPQGVRSNGRGPAVYDSQRALTAIGVRSNKHIPPPYLRASEKQRLELLRGLMDTDGHQSHSLSYFNTTSKRLADDVADLVVTLGWKAFRQESRAVIGGRDCGPAYRVGFRSDVCPFRLTRKVERWMPRGRQASRHTSRMVSSVERVPSVAVRCIRVDSPSHLYVAGRGAVPTHNTTDVAGLAISWLAMEAPARARGYVVASNGSQAAEVIDAAASLIYRTPGLEGVITPESERLVGPEEAWVQVLNASESGAWGKRDAHLLVCDEFAQWPPTRGAQRVYTAVRTTVQKTPGCRLIILTSAGEPAHWSYRVLQQAYRDTDGWRVHEVPGPVPWQDPAELAALRRELTPSDYSRLVLNQWTQSEDRLVSPEDLSEAMRLHGPVPPQSGRSYVIGLDLGLKTDPTVMAVCHGEPVTDDDTGSLIGTRVVLDKMLVWEGTRKRPVDTMEVERAVLREARAYNGAHVVADPWNTAEMGDRLRSQGVMFSQYVFSGASVAKLAFALYNQLRNRLILLPADDALAEELANVRLRETSVPGQRRMDHEAGGHDDRAVALALAVEMIVARPEWNLEGMYEPVADLPDDGSDPWKGCYAPKEEKPDADPFAVLHATSPQTRTEPSSRVWHVRDGKLTPA